MNLRVLIVLWIIVLVPLALMGGLGYDRFQQQKEMRDFQVQSLIETQLKAVDATLQNFFDSLADELSLAINELPDTPADIRTFLKTHSRLRQVLWFNAQGVRMHPPDKAPLTDKEKQFIERTLGVLPFSEQTEKVKRLTPFPSPQNSEAGMVNHGWFVWHSGSELVHFFWKRDKQKGLIGFELEPIRLLADVIAQLPTTGDTSDGLSNSRIKLIDASGSVAYQWGNYEPTQNEQASGLLPLSAPLASWHMEFFGAGLQGNNPFEWFNFAAGFFALGVVLFGLGFYVYREHTRELRLAQQRVNFVSQVSHELRTPLTNIRLYAEMLDEKLNDDETSNDPKARQYIEVITTECRRLTRLIANVLNFSRDTTQSKSARREPCNIDEVIQNALTAFSPTLKSKGVRIGFKQGASSTVLTDPDAVEQILNNLISNMEKYAASGKRLEIESRQDNTSTTIIVRDYGPGILKKERQKIFRPFYRTSSKLTDGVAGTGIGLSIARQLATQLGGTLTLVAVEQGACFQVKIITPRAGDAS